MSNGYLPPVVSDSGQRVTDLWVSSWIAVLAVGAVTWGLMLYAAVRFRKRKGDETLPVQLRYNVPMEMLYTVIPVFMVAVFFYYTARDEARLVDTSTKKDLTVSVVAKQWSWDFNYVDSNVHETGVHTELDGTEGKRAQMPVLYLPVNKRVEFVLNARDVIHSFWVPAFMMKMDMLPGKTNKFQLTPDPGRHVPGQVRRALRRLPLADALHGQGRAAGRVRPGDGPPRSPSARAASSPSTPAASRWSRPTSDKIPAPARTGSNR